MRNYGDSKYVSFNKKYFLFLMRIDIFCVKNMLYRTRVSVVNTCNSFAIQFLITIFSMRGIRDNQRDRLELWDVFHSKLLICLITPYFLSDCALVTSHSCHFILIIFLVCLSRKRSSHSTHRLLIEKGNISRLKQESWQSKLTVHLEFNLQTMCYCVPQ